MAGMTWSASRDDHLFVYWRGELIWKRWDDQGYSALFEAGRPPRNMVELGEADAIWAELEANPAWLDHVAELRDRAIDAYRAGETEEFTELGE